MQSFREAHGPLRLLHLLVFSSPTVMLVGGSPQFSVLNLLLGVPCSAVVCALLPAGHASSVSQWHSPGHEADLRLLGQGCECSCCCNECCLLFSPIVLLVTVLSVGCEKPFSFKLYFFILRNKKGKGYRGTKQASAPSGCHVSCEYFVTFAVSPAGFKQRPSSAEELGILPATPSPSPSLLPSDSHSQEPEILCLCSC